MEEEHHHYGGVTTTNTTPSAMTDLRHFFSPIPTPGHHLFSAAYAGPPLPHHYENMMLLHDFRSDNSAAAIMPNTSSAAGFEIDNATGASGLGFGVDGGATARWPRQETLTLLEIRSRLDHKFKEANHKGPLWDEVSRIMCEEHGYQRSGKKCREKFENLYKYYKKTKEGKAGRQDGKHYRFFRQLEALYGESTQHQHQHQHHHPIPISDHPHLNMISSATGVEFHGQEGFQSMSVSNTSSDFDTSSSVDVNGDSSPMGRSRKRRGSWKAKIKEFVDSQMRRIMEKQEAWLEKMMKTLENKEKERMLREEEWRKQETLRMDKEHKLWAKERAWIEARDKALMDALQRLTGKENDHKSPEMIKLLELRGSMQARFDHCNGGSESEEGDEIWKEISGRMACLGHDTTPKMCKEKWDFMSKKRKENSSSSRSHQYDYGEMNCALAPTQTRLGEVNSMTDSCFRILLGDEGGTTPWDHTYGVKLNKGD